MIGSSFYTYRHIHIISENASFIAIISNL